MSIGLIVEGHGEIDAAPVLVRAIAREHGVHHVDIPRPFRMSRGKLLKPAEYARALQLMARKVAPDGPVLTILDADEDCPVDLARDLVAIARGELPDRAVGVVAAKREYEAWLIASARTLAGKRGLPSDLDPPESPEEIRDAKGWLEVRMPRGYSETIDQAALTAHLSVEEARASSSFRKLERDVRRLLTRAGGP